MRWTGSRQRYQCDLGLGGRFFDVGSAAQIWSRQALVSEAVLTQARSQAPGRAPSASIPASTAADVTAMRAALRADFDSADVRWQDWRAR